jgi:Icc protein
MLIAQISDLHIGFDRGNPRELNSTRLGRVIARLLDVAPDMVVVTGDLTEHGDPDSYRKLKRLLEPLRMPVLLGVGNHDRRSAFTEIFPETPINDGFVQYAAMCGSLRIVILDTLEEGMHGGAFCTKRAKWLDACLAEQADTPTLVALHHPPLATGLEWMDTNAEGPWTERLAHVLGRHAQVVGLIAGHIHRTVAAPFAGRTLTVSSSTAPELALDLRPIDPSEPDGRPLIVAQAPAFTLHRWTEAGLVTHFATSADDPVMARFDEATQPMISALMSEPMVAGEAKAER